MSRWSGRRCILGRGGGVAAPFDPLSLSPTLLLDARVGVYSDAGVTPATNGGTVQQWNDRSGNARNLAQASASLRPVYSTGVTNGLPGIAGDGTDDYLEVAYNGTAPTAFTVSTVFNPAATVAGDAFLSWADSPLSGTPFMLFQRQSSTISQIYCDSGYRFSWLQADGEAKIVTLTCSGGSWDAWVNGVSQGNWTAGMANQANALNFYVSSGFSDESAVYIHNVFVKHAVLSAAERDALHRYWGALYGITVL